MDWDDRAETSHQEESLTWSENFNQVRGHPMAIWVSTFRNDMLCEVVADNCGSFNWSCKVRFEDGVQWMVRFAVPGRAMNSDEKVRHEVATMQFIAARTAIPVPTVIAWGLSKDNPLGIGSFIIMNFIEGEPLGKMLEVLPQPEDGQILRSDLTDIDLDLDIVYRQIANFLLELSAHDFSQIGTISKIDGSYVVDSRPLTLKMNEVESHGGVQLASRVSNAFSSATEYFLHVAEQDEQHLYEQPNSIDDADDARMKLVYSRIFKAIISHFVSDKHNSGPFKLICDDMRFGNMLVNKDLKIVAVLDWEWSYAAPYQMLYSPPRWLLIKKPILWDAEDPLIESHLSRYMHHFQKFVAILREEEGKRDKDTAVVTLEHERLSSLMQKSMEDGKLWFHELIYTGFKSAKNEAWTAIRKILPNLEDLVTVSEFELDSFIKLKMEQMIQYKEEWAAMEKDLEEKAAEFEALKERVRKFNPTLEEI